MGTAFTAIDLKFCPVPLHGNQHFLGQALALSTPELDYLLALARQMDPNALGQIHDRYYPEVYRYLRFRLEDKQICEEIAAEVFLRLLNALQKKRGLDRNLGGWLIGTASHLVNDHLRNRHAGRMDHFAESAASTWIAGDTPEDSLEALRKYRQVRQALLKLAPEQQHLLALRFAEDRSIEETASMTGKIVSAVKDLQFRALAALWGMLQEERI
jgi:RNA polymerase sigma-70 factor (ECF subfamily)